MAEVTPAKTRGFSVDWLVKGSLTKIGDIFDRLTGRGWKPSSTLATSELIERMKSMMDAEVRANGDKRKYVPHNIKLKMQWDKFSTDSADALRKLEHEFLIAAVDHINDRHYFTYAPISIEVKPDYFTSGVKLFLSFDKLEGDGSDAELDVTLDNLKSSELLAESASDVTKQTGHLTLSFVAGGKPIVREIALVEGMRLSVGRTKENDIAIDDQSISKAHASLLLNKEGSLIVADTGSTNGTLVRGERIAYGKAVAISSGDPLMFGLVKVDVKVEVKAVEPAPTEAFKIGEFEFSSKSGTQARNPVSSEGTPELRSDVKKGTVPTGRFSTSDADPPLTAAANPVERENVAPIVKPATQSPGRKPDVAPQPALSEAKVDIEKEKQDWEV